MPFEIQDASCERHVCPPRCACEPVHCKGVKADVTRYLARRSGLGIDEKLFGMVVDIRVVFAIAAQIASINPAKRIGALGEAQDA